MLTDHLMEWIGIAFAVAMLILFLIVIWKIYMNQIDIRSIIREPDSTPGPDGQHKASLSRFQLLLFTIVVAGLYGILCIKAQNFVEIPDSVLGLLGISAGGFVVSKGIGKTGKKEPAGG